MRQLWDGTGLMRAPIAITPLVRNILANYDAADSAMVAEGMLWYQSALADCESLAIQYGFTTAQACGIVAALSPNLRWEYNIRAAHQIIAGGVTQAYPANEYKARRIIAGELPEDVLGGLKVNAFYRNILNGGMDDGVTIDGHAFNAAFDIRQPVKKATITPRQYAALVKAYRIAGRLRGVTGAECQAVVWSVWRDGMSDRYHPRHFVQVAS